MRTRGWRFGGATAFALLVLVGVAGRPAGTLAAGPLVVVEPTGPLGDGPQTITIRGSGFDPEANGGVGIYVVFGQRLPPPGYHDDALLYQAARWVHRGASDTPGQAALLDDGTFETTLEIAPRYVDGHDRSVDCLAVDCAVITMAAHGVADRAFDTFTPISFDAEAPVVPASSSAGSTPGPFLLVGALVAVGLGVVVVALVLVRRRRPSGAPATRSASPVPPSGSRERSGRR